MANAKQVKDCSKICDFCKHFNFNGEPLIDKDGKQWENAIYVGKGWCCLHKRREDPAHTCEKFSCQSCGDSQKK